MTKDETIDMLWENSNHGTQREDVVAAYNAGAAQERESCAERATMLEDEIERLKINNGRPHPSLTPVIIWLENGCNPQDAAQELRLYEAMAVEMINNQPPTRA